jgi:hypothetical protein
VNFLIQGNAKYKKLFIPGNIIANTLREDNVFRVAFTPEKEIGFEKYTVHLYQ